jgi:hypothetical protein
MGRKKGVTFDYHEWGEGKAPHPRKAAEGEEE